MSEARARHFRVGALTRNTALAVAICVLFASGLSAELPRSFRGWESSAVETISLPQLSAAAGDNAEVVREYGFLGAERRRYTKNGTGLTVTLWRMQDATGSFGLFTFLSEPGMVRPREAKDLIAHSPGTLLIQRGPYLLEARGTGLTEADSSELAKFVAPSGPGDNLLPPLPGYLPAEGLVPQSERFLIGPIAFARVVDRLPASGIGFQSGAEAIIADYRTGNTLTKLLLVSYATPQLASRMLDSFQQLPALASGTSGRTLFVERKSNLVAFVIDAPTLAAAESLLDRVNYEANLTWNEYVPPRGENVGGMMIALFSLAGLVLLGAFVAGIAFGGVRILTKRFIPIPVFDRPDRVEFIQLNIGGSK